MIRHLPPLQQSAHLVDRPPLRLINVVRLNAGRPDTLRELADVATTDLVGASDDTHRDGPVAHPHPNHRVFTHRSNSHLRVVL